MNDEFYSPQQIAKMSGVSYPTVLSHIKSGKIPAMTMGGYYAVRREDAEAWITLGGEEVSEENLARLERCVATIKERLAAKKQAQQLRGQYD